MRKTSRRNFLKSAGMSLPAFALPAGKIRPDKLPGYSYGTIHTLDEAFTREGHILLRVEFTGTSPQTAGKVIVSGAKSHTIRNWFFDPIDIMLIRLEGAKETTTLTLKSEKESVKFTLKDVLEHKTWLAPWGTAIVNANFLLDRETGIINPADVSVAGPGENFSFVIMSDPQGGNPEEPTNRVPARMKIHNAFIEESIRLVNELTPPPAFVIVNGDIVDSEGQAKNYEQMLSFFEKIKVPILFQVGNHETRYNAVFSPGYYMEEFNNFFAAQKQINGLEKLLYSFDLGQWHFVVFPDPLRTHFWETHPHYFEWLENDLAANANRPVIVFHHVPLQPIGIDPLINYVESVAVKRFLLEILTKHGNVQYAFSGHVHIPIKASFKTAITYKGIRFINLPAAGYRPRSFGEPDFDGGPTQGITIVKISGNQANVSFKTVTNKVFPYPDLLQEFTPSAWPLWLNDKWELPAGETILNGSFEEGLAHWHRRFVYLEDKSPSFRCEVQRVISGRHSQALYLGCKGRGYHIPGQDRMPQTLYQVCQPLAVPAGKAPVITFSYKLDPQTFDPGCEAGAFVWVEGFQGSRKRLNMVYSAGMIIQDPGGKYSQAAQVWYQHYDLSESQPYTWKEVNLNILKDFEENLARPGKFFDANIDRLIITLGVWTANESEDQTTGVFFDDIAVNFAETPVTLVSNVNGEPLVPKPENRIWKKVNRHIAGEHQYIERE